ncbi:MAG: EpsG family protein [Bacteroidia bacterium]|nr:EpsG family protein [Bacteroidia bacterium]
MVYLVALVLILIPFIRFDILKKGGKERLWYYICLSALTLIAGLRYRVGGDTLGYMVHFETYPDIAGIFRFNFEAAYYMPLWYVYNSIFKSLGDSFYVFQIVQAFLVNAAFFRFFKRYSKHFFAVLLVYFVGYYLFYNTEILRSALCVALFLEAYPFLEKKKYHWYFLLSLVAVGFHISAVFIFIVPLFRLIKKENFIFCIVSGVVILLMASLINVKSIIESVDIQANTGFKFYIVSRLDSYAKSIAPITKYVLFDKLTICIPILGVMLLRRIFGYDNDRRFGVAAMVMVIIQFATLFHNVIGRLNDYLIPFMLVYLVNTLLDNRDNIAKNKYSITLAALSAISFFGVVTVKYCRSQTAVCVGSHIYDRYIPYSSVFNEQKHIKREIIVDTQYNNTPETTKDEREQVFFEDYEIKAEKVWTNDTIISDSCIVEKGNRLIIKDCTVRVKPDCRIIVHRGGVLIIDNAIIDADFSDGVRQWQGIQVHGSNSLNQFNVNGIYKQGYVELHNAVIKNAIIGVDLGDTEDWFKKGGIIHAENSSFINNTRAIHAENYRNVNPNTFQTADYNAWFDNCVFEINEDYIGTEMFYKHVDLYETRGLKFNDCRFVQTVKNEKISNFSVGIEANDGDFVLRNGYFSGFHRAIAAICVNNNIISEPKIFNSVFKENNICIELKNCQKAVVISSEFHIDKSVYQNSGISIIGLTDLIVENNTFNALNREYDNECFAIYSTHISEKVNFKNNIFNGIPDFNQANHVDVGDVSLIGTIKRFDDGSEGVVFYDDGNGHGLVVSMTETTAYWSKSATDITELENDPGDEVKVPDETTEDGFVIEFDNTIVARGLDFRRGAHETDIIMSRLCDEATAAAISRELGDEWYLPSIGEMARLLTTANKGLGKIGPISEALFKNGGTVISSNKYWTSTERNAEEAWFIETKTKGIMAQEKFYIAKVRAIRAF